MNNPSYTPGKYDRLCAQAREEAQAHGAILLIIKGNCGNGFSVAATAEVVAALPGLLRDVADKIEGQMGGEGPESWPEERDLGPCCCCGGRELARNLIALNFRAPVPGTGWGCFVCRQPQDGAIALLCDACMEAKNEPKEVCLGLPADKKRMPIAELDQVPFEHNREFHPETWKCRECGCTQDQACAGGCDWAEMDLCTSCKSPIILP